MITRPRFIDKPWGSETIISETTKYTGKIITIEAGARLSRQVHFTKEESFYVVEGSMILQIGEPFVEGFEEYVMKLGDCFHCPAGTLHRMCAGQEGCVLIETSTSHPDDIERIEDDYGRL